MTDLAGILVVAVLFTVFGLASRHRRAGGCGACDREGDGCAGCHGPTTTPEVHDV